MLTGVYTQACRHQRMHWLLCLPMLCYNTGTYTSSSAALTMLLTIWLRRACPSGCDGRLY